MKDYRQKQDGDLDLDSGDLLVIESTSQHQRDLLLSDKGHIRDKAEAGVGIINYLNDENREELLRTVRKEFTSDGMKVSKLSIDLDTFELNIEAEYEEN